MRDRDACSWLLNQTRRQEPSAEDTTHLSDWIQRNEGTTHLSDRIQRNEGTTHFVYKTHKKNQVSIELESTCWLTSTVLEGVMQATSSDFTLAAILPGKICPLGCSGSSLIVLINHTAIGLEALSTRKNTHLVLLNPIKTH